MKKVARAIERKKSIYFEKHQVFAIRIVKIEWFLMNKDVLNYFEVTLIQEKKKEIDIN